MSEINFEKIYDQYMDKIYRFVFMRVGSKETAQDLTSETFTRSFEYFRQNPAKAIDNVQAFLFRTASNLLTDFYRQKSRQNISFDSGMSNFSTQTIAARDEHLEISVAKSEQTQKVMAALQNIDSKLADIVMWRYVEDMSVKEISEITGRPEGTVRVMLHRGLKELRRTIL